VNLTIEKVVIIVAEFHYLFVVIFTTSFLQCVSREADTFSASNPVIAWKLIALLALEIVHSHKVHKPGSSRTGPHRIVADDYY